MVTAPGAAPGLALCVGQGSMLIEPGCRRDHPGASGERMSPAPGRGAAAPCERRGGGWSEARPDLVERGQGPRAGGAVRAAVRRARESGRGGGLEVEQRGEDLLAEA